MKLQDTKYKLGDIVFHKLATERHACMITAITFSLGGGYFYNVSGEGFERSFYEHELTDEFIEQYGMSDEPI